MYGMVEFLFSLYHTTLGFKEEWGLSFNCISNDYPVSYSGKNKVGIQMAQQIQDLVASIRKDGIEAAQKEAAQIIADAKNQADELIAKAKKEASHLIDTAQKEMDTRDQSARSSLQQASRDVQLSLKKSIQKQLDQILVEKLEKAMSSKELVALVEVAIGQVEDVSKKQVQVNQKAFEELAENLKVGLSDKIKKGLEIKAVNSVATGFRIAEKDGSGFYDFSAEETAQLLKPFLSEAIAKLVFTATN